MESLVQFDCLPRLIDSALCDEGPEIHFVRTWRNALSDQRIQAEAALGYELKDLKKFWQSGCRRGLDDQKRFDVQRNTEEFRLVQNIFKAFPKETPAYNLGTK